MKKLFFTFWVGVQMMSASSVFAEDFAFSDVIRQFDVDITLNEDGSIDVVEKILYDFGDREGHGIIREIPTVYGFGVDEVELGVELEKVTNEEGVLYVYTDTPYYYEYEIQIGDPYEYVSGQKWYYIYYSVDDVVNGFDTHDELYWNATGTNWDVLIESSTVNVYLPEGGESSLATCYTGEFGSELSNCVAETRGSELFFQTTMGLGLYEGMTVVAGFEKGLVEVPAIVKFDVRPEESEISLTGDDGQPLWILSPKSVRLDPGTYDLEIDKGWRYQPYKETFNLAAGETKFIAMELERTPVFIFFELYFPVGVFVISILWVVLHWFRKGRDPAGRGTIMPLYKAPKEDAHLISPGALGVIVDETADLKDITATIFHLGDKGYLTIKKEEKKAKFLWGEDDDYTFTKVKDLKDGEGLADFEKEIFEVIFKGEKKVVKLSELQNEFYKSLDSIKKKLYQGVIDAGYFANNPENVKGDYLAAGLLILAGLLVVGGVAAWFFESGYYLYLWPLIGATIAIFSPFMSKKTKVGVEMYEKVLGYKMFLNAAEKDRIEKLFSPKEYQGIFLENLPYAIVLGVEDEWAKQFKGLFDGVPDWYQGPTNMSNFMTAMHTFNRVAKSAYVSKPLPKAGSGGKGGSSGWGSSRRSGGSSWSGSSGSSGGFSGGGFGGGGGGRW